MITGWINKLLKNEKYITTLQDAVITLQLTVLEIQEELLNLHDRIVDINKRILKLVPEDNEIVDSSIPGNDTNIFAGMSGSDKIPNQEGGF